MDSWKSRGGESQRGEEKKWEDQRRKKKQVRKKVGKSAIHCVFPTICGSGRKVGSLKRRVRSQLQVKMHTSPHERTAFGSWDVEKVHSRCCAKHISKSKCAKHTILGPFLEVEMSKKCTPLLREAHFQVKLRKAHHSRTTFLTFRCRKSAHRCGAKHISKQKNTKCHMYGPLLTFRCRKSAHCCGAKHISKSKCTKRHMYGPLLTVEIWFCVAGARDSAPCQKWAKRQGFLAVSTTTATTICYTTLHYTTLHYTTLQ